MLIKNLYRHEQVKDWGKYGHRNPVDEGLNCKSLFAMEPNFINLVINSITEEYVPLILQRNQLIVCLKHKVNKNPLPQVENSICKAIKEVMNHF